MVQLTKRQRFILEHANTHGSVHLRDSSVVVGRGGNTWRVVESLVKRGYLVENSENPQRFDITDAGRAALDAPGKLYMTFNDPDTWELTPTEGEPDGKGIAYSAQNAVETLQTDVSILTEQLEEREAEVKRLKEDIERLLAALKPFANYVQWFNQKPMQHDFNVLTAEPTGTVDKDAPLIVAHFRAAAAEVQSVEAHNSAAPEPAPDAYYEPDPDAYYIELEREHWRQLDAAEQEAEEQRWFEENEDNSGELDEPMICSRCGGRGHLVDDLQCPDCWGEGYWY